MTRDELAARLFVSLIEDERSAITGFLDKSERLGWVSETAAEAFEWADAFEAERKRRLTEPDDA